MSGSVAVERQHVCDYCQRAFTGQTFGRGTLDTACMPCWWDWQDLQAITALLRPLTDPEVELPEDDALTLETLDELIEGQNEYCEERGGEIEDKQRELGDQMDVWRGEIDALNEITGAGDVSRRDEIDALKVKIGEAEGDRIGLDSEALDLAEREKAINQAGKLLSLIEERNAHRGG